MIRYVLNLDTLLVSLAQVKSLQLFVGEICNLIFKHYLFNPEQTLATQDKTTAEFSALEVPICIHQAIFFLVTKRPSLKLKTWPR